eukprot:COSAG02_NODE_17372_length_1009_cov_1.510989_1_plen_103_part_00
MCRVCVVVLFTNSNSQLPRWHGCVRTSGPGVPSAVITVKAHAHTGAQIKRVLCMVGEGLNRECMRMRMHSLVGESSEGTRMRMRKRVKTNSFSHSILPVVVQ